ncbi:tetratricopeptide repeat protein [Croceitalea marina]|uniref:Tetratricopeptide repeat protein n=1 Tax=Croceitalea marina TaxID=1775166 RepID=A0ABW5MXW3_9FLAO
MKCIRITPADVIEQNLDFKIYKILDDEGESPLKWNLTPTSLQIIPNDTGHYLVKAFIIDESGVDTTALINVSTPERIADFTIYDFNSPKYSSISEQTGIGKNVIPAVASDAFGSYEFYYARNNPDIGIEVLKNGVILSTQKTVIAEDLAYILRDEKRLEDALNYFLIAEEYGQSSEFILFEIEQLYCEMENYKKALEYKRKREKIKNN